MMHICTCNSSSSLTQLTKPAQGADQSVDAETLLHERNSANLGKMTEAVTVLLKCIGEDPLREGLIDTPRRVAKAWLDMTSGEGQNHATAFGSALFHEPKVKDSSATTVLVRDISFASLSSFNLLPFYGVCHLAYVPQDGVILGLSKLARVARCLASRIQSQTEFTEALIQAIATHVVPLGAAVFVEAWHFEPGGRRQRQCTIACTGCFQGGGPSSNALEELKLLINMSTATANGPSFPLVEGQLPIGASSCGAGKPADTLQMEAAALTLVGSTWHAGTKHELGAAAANFISWLSEATSGYAMKLDEQIVAAKAEECLPVSLETGVNMLSCEFVSLCEHHMLPFCGTVCIAFTPCKASQTYRPVFPARVFRTIVGMYSKRLQVQERLTQQIADASVALLQAESVLVVCKSSHMCMVARGVEDHTSSTVTTAARGKWVSDAQERYKVLQRLL